MSSSLDMSDNIALEGAPLSRHGLIKFLVPSLLGVLLFLVPFSVGGTINIGMGFAADGLKALLGVPCRPSLR
jgi:nucleoside recognition membrane protein YjiH